MRYGKRSVVLASVVLFGIVHAELAPVPLNYIRTQSPTVSYIFTHLIDSQLFWPILLVHDLVINVVVHLPGAVILAFFFVPKVRYAALLFVVVNFLWTYRFVLNDPQFFLSLNITSLIPIIVITLLPIVLVRLVRSKYRDVS